MLGVEVTTHYCGGVSSAGHVLLCLGRGFLDLMEQSLELLFSMSGVTVNVREEDGRRRLLLPSASGSASLTVDY